MRNEPRLQPFAPGAGTPPPEVAGFAKSLTLKFAEIEVGLEFDPEPGLVDRLMEATYDVVGARPVKVDRRMTLRLGAQLLGGTLSYDPAMTLVGYHGRECAISSRAAFPAPTPLANPDGRLYLSPMGAPEIDISRLNVEERIALMGRIWDSLSDEDVPVTPELAAELKRRLAVAEANPAAWKDWETVDEELGRRLP